METRRGRNTVSNSYAFIGGGSHNTASSPDAVVAGGFTNTAAGNSAFVGGGRLNSNSGIRSAIVGGECNIIVTGSNYSIIGGGFRNNMFNTSKYSVIAGGIENNIGSTVAGYSPVDYGFIGSGAGNCLDSSLTSGAEIGVIGGGVANKICANACFASVLNGFENTVSGTYASILSGRSNTASGYASVILGGNGSSDGGFNYAGVFGQGITAVAPNTFHVECLNACGTRIYSGVGSVCVGEIFASNLPYAGTGSVYPLFIRKI